jgi:hypothetical protein
MSEPEKELESREERNKRLKEQMSLASTRLSEAVRIIAFGQIGVTYTIVISNTPFATAIKTSYPNCIYFIFGFGCVALLFDTLQYFVMFERSLYFMQNPDKNDKRGRGHFALWFFFRTKGLVAIIGIFMLGAVLFAATGLAARFNLSKSQNAVFAQPIAKIEITDSN